MADGTISTAPPGLRVETNLPRDPRLYQREHTQNIRQALREAAEEHHARHIPRHFEAFAAAKYGYLPRTPRYRNWKRRRGLPDLPNVATGAMRAQTTSMRIVTATQYRATLKLRWDWPKSGGPSGSSGRFRLKQGQTELSQSQKQILARIEELRAVSSDELQYIAKFIGDRYAAMANAPGTRYRTRNRTTASGG